MISLTNNADAVVSDNVAVVCFSRTAARTQLVTCVGAITRQSFTCALGTKALEEKKRGEEDGGDSSEKDGETTVVARGRASDAANQSTVALW